MSLIEAVAGNGLVAGQLLLTGIAEEKRVRWYAAHRPERHRAPVRCAFSTKAGDHSNAGANCCCSRLLRLPLFWNDLRHHIV